MLLPFYHSDRLKTLRVNNESQKQICNCIKWNQTNLVSEKVHITIKYHVQHSGSLR